MNGNTNQALCDVLDEREPAAGAGSNDGRRSEDLAALLQEEHEARLQAEASCQDHVQRLAVHSEQVSEYAQQKATDLAEIRKQAAALKGLLGMPDASNSPELAENLNRLFKYLEDASDDALSFANQAQQDANRHRIQPDASGNDAEQQQRENDDSQVEPVPPTNDSGIAPDAANEAHDTSEAMDADDVPAGPGSPTAPKQGQIGVLAAIGSPQMPVAAVTASPALAMFRDQATYTPMRLDMRERRYFQLLEATLGVSEYTDKVDILTWKRKDGRVMQQVKDICSILSGLVVAQDYRRGQELVKNRDFKANEQFFQDVFEVGRRYKIMNPDRMRGTYGKLLYMLMDTADSNIEELLEFSCIKPLMTVKKYLESVGASKVLEDPRLMIATAEIDGSPDRPRHQIQQDLAKKEAARKQLARTYGTNSCPPDDILTAVYSLSDYNTYLLFNRDPVERMLKYLRRYFDPHKCSEGESLAISSGRGGARLSHNHERQYAYVMQSLLLWSEIAKSMFKLWCLAEQDLLSRKNRYRLCDTGQGLNRVQAAPLVGQAMHDILRRCQGKVGSWVGSSVVHLGDTNVPNALMFIDKYTQVPRILNPVAQVLDELPRLADRDSNVKNYVEAAFGSVDKCRRYICQDFFRHAFDGSGADNFFDAGSCIDGRLTSAWNWCSKIEKKNYYVVFKMCGFTGFDGDFK